MSSAKGSSLQRAEAEYHSVIERTERERQKVRARRRQAFQGEVGAGRSYRDIGEELGLNHTRVSQVINGKNR